MVSLEENRKNIRRPNLGVEADMGNENKYDYPSRYSPTVHESPSYTQSSPYGDPDYIESENAHHTHGPSSSSPHYEPAYPKRGDSHRTHLPNSEAFEEDITLGQYILNRVGDAFKGLFRDSHTILRVDLRQAIRYDGPVLQKKRGPGRPRTVAGRGGRTPARVSEVGYEEENEGAVQTRGWFHGLQGGGARLKLMQVWDFKDTETGEERLPWNVNLGFGANVVMDRGEVQPKLRIRAKYAAFHFLPEPYLELRGKWPLGSTNLAIRARYRVPVSSMSQFWESTSSRLMINLYHCTGTGVHLTPGGVEFDDQMVPIGKFGTMRIVAAVDFPRQFPLEEGEQPIKLRITRLGLKSRIM